MWAYNSPNPRRGGPARGAQECGSGAGLCFGPDLTQDEGTLGASRARSARGRVRASPPPSSTVLPLTRAGVGAQPFLTGNGRLRHAVGAEGVDDDVVTGPAVERIVARPADEHVVLIAAEERVVNAPARGCPAPCGRRRRSCPGGARGVAKLPPEVAETSECLPPADVGSSIHVSETSAKCQRVVFCWNTAHPLDKETQSNVRPQRLSHSFRNRRGRRHS
jgi:hypothetical protein